MTVIPKVRQQGTMGSTLVDGDPVDVHGVHVQPVSTAEGEDHTSASATYKIIGTGDWPGGSTAQITVTTGRVAGEYDQEGPARYHGYAPHNEHYVVFATLRSEV